MIGIGDEILRDDVDKGPSDYWDCRRQLLLLEGMHTKFEYLFRLLEFSIGSIAFLFGMVNMFADWDMSGDLEWTSISFLLGGLALMAYVRMRKLPVSAELMRFRERDPIKPVGSVEIDG